MCGTFKNHTHESNMWISAGGTRSVIHYDADHNFHCIIDGRKDFILVPNNLATKTNLYFKQKVRYFEYIHLSSHYWFYELLAIIKGFELL